MPVVFNINKIKISYIIYRRVYINNIDGYLVLIMKYKKTFKKLYFILMNTFVNDKFSNNLERYSNFI